MSTNTRNPAPIPLQSPLTADELELLRAWRMPFVRLPVHAEIEYAIKRAMAGSESSAIIGRRGVGKTFTLEHLLARVEGQEVEASLDDATYRPRSILRYESSGARGAKTALLDLHRQLMAPVSAGGSRATPLQLIEQIAAECQYKGLSLICVDEAQMLSADNLELLRQVPDKARAMGHPLGLLVAGSEELRDTLVSIQQLGQRFASEIRMHPLSDHDFTKHWTGLHPHLPPMRAGMATRDWTRLEAHVRTAVAGKMRRLAFVMENANALALQWDRPVDEAILRAAVSRLAAER